MRLRFFLSIGMLGWLLLLPFREVQATSSSLFVSEVSIAGDKTSDEFIELWNTSGDAIDLAGMQLRKRTQSGSESSIKVFSKNSIIPAHGAYLWANSQGIFQAPFADTETSASTLATDNSIGLFTQSGAGGVLIDSLAWGTGSPFSPDTPVFSNPAAKKSFTRDLATLSWSLTEDLTPTNSRGAVWTPPLPDPLPTPLPSLSPVRFNELLPNPAGDEGIGEFIELYNTDTDTADISSFTLHDASKTGSYTFPPNTHIAGQSYFVLTRTTSKLSLNNTDEILSLFDTNNALVDSVRYDTTKEGVSLNLTSSGWRGGTPTPGTTNDPNALPETREKVPKKGYHGVPVTFDAQGKDTDGDTLKYVWDFGDGHKSYKDKTTHTYEDNGRYVVTLTTTDGSDNVVETFPLTIESLPKPNVHITALMPNPAGNDSEHEWITLENRGKKSINLKGFSIATGWKKLANHPIRESFIIKPGRTATLSRDLSLFTLPNQKGRIELRAPDGKVLQKVTYKLPKTITEDTVYRKKKGQAWEWQKRTSETIPHQPTEIVLPEPVPSTETTTLPVSVLEPVSETAAPVPADTPAERPTTETIPPEEIGEKQVLGAETILTETVPGTATGSVFDFFRNFFANLNEKLNTWQNNL